ncbi:MAG: hypothetical protein M1831_002046 [Alyxoria varia]|nr:MAG: hypothetical protein M1831_002046 [Alyxoria varia]
MAVALGKRKRTNAIEGREQGSSSSSSPTASEPEDDKYQDIFKRHFESHFAPLEDCSTPSDSKPREVRNLNENTDEASDWSGLLSEDEQPENVEHNDLLPQTSSDAKVESKRFMSAKPPIVGRAAKIIKPAIMQDDAEDEQSEKFNLQNDLALQRLINESHILDKAHNANSAQSRQRILDMRMQSLGSKKSMLAQEKMPMSHRKGIVAKGNEKEGRRRQEAKENGIVLEKASKLRKSTAPRRLRGVDGPAVGKFEGGTLNLSKRDVASINNSNVKA